MELEPCPFCGCEQIASYPYKGYTHKICCYECSAQLYRATEEEAIEAWNRRAAND